MREIFTFWVPFLVAIISLIINVIQMIGYRRVRNKISVWAKDAKGMISSIVGIEDNIKNKKITSLAGVNSNIQTLGNFANSMFVSMEEELGRTKREIKPEFEKKSAVKNGRSAIKNHKA
ncbi:hypothetical protein HYZ76_00385 [Candidatus Falkowbacteria bacterium]|nr:hypothetical protein [Candidatus Falkowbacteria bacterium]